jgi:ankyrin repeat protein
MKLIDNIPIELPFAIHRFSTVERFKSFLKKNPEFDINKKDHQNWSFLFYASYYNNLETLDELLKHPKIDVNMQDKNGNTPLIHASLRGNGSAIKSLLQHGANPFIRNTYDNQHFLDVLKLRYSIKHVNLIKYAENFIKLQKL